MNRHAWVIGGAGAAAGAVLLIFGVTASASASAPSSHAIIEVKPGVTVPASHVAPRHGEWDGVMAGTPTMVFDSSVGGEVTVSMPLAGEGQQYRIAQDNAGIASVISTPTQTRSGQVVMGVDAPGVTRMVVTLTDDSGAPVGDPSVYEMRVA